MKTRITMLLALLLALVCTAASAQEYYTLPEIREQAEQGWHETYTDKYGRQTTVDIDVQVFGDEKAPVSLDLQMAIIKDVFHGTMYAKPV